MGIKARRCNEIIERIENIVENFEKYAVEVGIREETYVGIAKILKVHSASNI